MFIFLCQNISIHVFAVFQRWKNTEVSFRLHLISSIFIKCYKNSDCQKGSDCINGSVFLRVFYRHIPLRQ